MTHSGDHETLHAGLSALFQAPDQDLADRTAALFAPECAVHLSAPFGQMSGQQSVLDTFLEPLRAAFAGSHRRDEIFIAGSNRRAAGGRWASSVTHDVGNFVAPFAGLRPSGHLAFVRAGKFFRFHRGRITQAYIIIDLPDLMRQSQRLPVTTELGTEMLFPGSATHDGGKPGQGDRAASLDVVERMLGDLHGFDPLTFDSRDQTSEDGAWTDDMLWYGPGGIGSSFRLEGFVKDHRNAFLSAFPDRRDGDHYCRIGDGNYAAVSGWPSLTMTHTGPYLGIPATDRQLSLRVMDFCRIAGGRIAETWVLLDYVDLFAQMGVDLIAEANAMA